MEGLWNKGTTHGCFIRAESLGSSHERVIGIPRRRCVNRARKKYTIRKRERNNLKIALTQPFRDHSDPSFCRRNRRLSRVLVTPQWRRNDKMSAYVLDRLKPGWRILSRLAVQNQIRRGFHPLRPNTHRGSRRNLPSRNEKLRPYVRHA